MGGQKLDLSLCCDVFKQHKARRHMVKTHVSWLVPEMNCKEQEGVK